MVTTAEPLAPQAAPPTQKLYILKEEARPVELSSKNGITCLAYGLKLNFGDPAKPDITGTGGQKAAYVDENTRAQPIKFRGERKLPGTVRWEYYQKIARPDRPADDKGVNNNAIKAERPPEGQWTGLQDSEILVMPGLPGKGDVLRIISVRPDTVIARKIKDPDGRIRLRIYRKVPDDNVASVTDLSANALYNIQSHQFQSRTPEPTTPETHTDPILNATAVPAIDTPDEPPIDPISSAPSNVDYLEKPGATSINSELDLAVEAGALQALDVPATDIARLPEQVRRRDRLTDWVRKKGSMAIMEAVRLRREWQSLPPWARYAIRTTTITLIPLIPLLLQTGSMPIPDVHAGPPIAGDTPHPPLGHADVAISNLQPEPLPVIAEVPPPTPPIQTEPPTPPVIETPPTANTPPALIDNVCQVATDGPRASDQWPYPAGWTPTENFQNDVFQPAADFNNAIFDKVATCGNEAFNTDGSLIWDKVKGVITEGEFNTFNNNLEHVARTTNLTGNPLDDSYVPKVSTPREAPGPDKD